MLNISYITYLLKLKKIRVNLSLIQIPANVMFLVMNLSVILY